MTHLPSRRSQLIRPPGEPTHPGLRGRLESLRQRAEDILRPTEEKLPNYEDVTW